MSCRENGHLAIRPLPAAREPMRTPAKIAYISERAFHGGLQTLSPLGVGLLVSHTMEDGLSGKLTDRSELLKATPF